MDVKNKIINIVQFVFEVDEDADIENYSAETASNWDSMKQVLLISALENEFDVFIEAEEASTLNSYKKIVHYFDNI